jgi:hypothetical protein
VGDGGCWWHEWSETLEYEDIYLFSGGPTCQCGFAGAGILFSYPYTDARWTQLYARARARGHRFTPVSAPVGSGIRGYAGFFCSLPSLAASSRCVLPITAGHPYATVARSFQIGGATPLPLLSLGDMDPA